MDMTRQVLTATLERFTATFTGEVVDASHPGYAEARRVWNGSIDRHPRLIARCSGPGDVVTAVRHAVDAELEVAVRGGGHSFPGLSTVDDGIVIDLSPMNDVEVDPAAGTVRVGAGTLLGELDAATQRHGLAVPTGAVSHTGVAGLTLGGGIGWLMRKYGLTIDQLRAVDLVTADGRSDGVRAHESRAVLGRAWWRWQFRDRDRLHLRTQSRRPSRAVWPGAVAVG